MKFYLIFLLGIHLSQQETCHFDNVNGLLDLSVLNGTFKAAKADDGTLKNGTVVTEYFFHPCSDTKTSPSSWPPTNKCTEMGFSVS